MVKKQTRFLKGISFARLAHKQTPTKNYRVWRVAIATRCWLSQHQACLSKWTSFQAQFQSIFRLYIVEKYRSKWLMRLQIRFRCEHLPFIVMLVMGRWARFFYDSGYCCAHKMNECGPDRRPHMEICAMMIYWFGVFPRPNQHQINLCELNLRAQ